MYVATCMYKYCTKLCAFLWMCRNLLHMYYVHAHIHGTTYTTYYIHVLHKYVYVHVLLFFVMSHNYVLYIIPIAYACMYEYNMMYTYVHVRLAGRRYWCILWQLPHAVECVLPSSSHWPAEGATWETPPLLCTVIYIDRLYTCTQTGSVFMRW